MNIERMSVVRNENETPDNLPVVDKAVFDELVADNKNEAPLVADNRNEASSPENLKLAKDRALELIAAMKKQGVPMTKQVVAGIGRLAMKVAKDPKRSASEAAKFGGKIVWGIASYKGMREAWREAGETKDVAQSFDHISKELLKTRHKLFNEESGKKSEAKAEMKSLLAELREVNQSLPKEEAAKQRKVLADILAENRTRKAELRDSDSLPAESLANNLKTIEEGIERSKKLLVKEKRLEAATKGVGTSVLYLGLATGGLGAGVGVSVRAGADSLKRSASLERQRHREHAKSEEDKTQINAKTILVDGVKETLAAARKGDTEAIVKSLTYAIGVGFAADRVLGDDSVKEAAHGVFNELVGVKPAFSEEVNVGVGAADSFLEMLRDSGDEVVEPVTESPADTFLQAVEDPALEQVEEGIDGPTAPVTEVGGGMAEPVTGNADRATEPSGMRTAPNAGVIEPEAVPVGSVPAEDLSAPEVAASQEVETAVPITPEGLRSADLDIVAREYAKPANFEIAKVIFSDAELNVLAEVIDRMLPQDLDEVVKILNAISSETTGRVEAILDSLPTEQAEELRQLLGLETVVPEVVTETMKETDLSDSDTSGIQTEIDPLRKPVSPALQTQVDQVTEPRVPVQIPAEEPMAPKPVSDVVHESPLPPPQPLSVQNIEVPSGEGNSLSEAFHAAWQAGEINGLPEMSNDEFLNKMYEAIHALDNNSAVMAAVQTGINDLDVIQPGNINVQPLVDYMNGESVEEIQSKLVQQGFGVEDLAELSNLPELVYSVEAGDPGVSYRLLDEYPEIFGEFGLEEWNEFIISVNSDPELLAAAQVESGDLNKIFAGDQIRLDLLARHSLEMQGLATEAVSDASSSVVHVPVQSVESAPAVSSTTLEESVNRLSRLYAEAEPDEAAQALASMEPSAAASLITNMPLADGVEILREMVPNDAANILAHLEPERSEEMAKAVSESYVTEPEVATIPTTLETAEVVPADPATYIAENWPESGFSSNEEAKQFFVSAGIAHETTEVELDEGKLRMWDKTEVLQYPTIDGNSDMLAFYEDGSIWGARAADNELLELNKAFGGGAEGIGFYRDGTVMEAWTNDGLMLTHPGFEGGAESIDYYEDGSLDRVIAAEDQTLRHPDFEGEANRIYFYPNGNLEAVEGYSITHQSLEGEISLLEFNENESIRRVYAEDVEQGITDPNLGLKAESLGYYEDGLLAYVLSLKDQPIEYQGSFYEQLSLNHDGTVDLTQSVKVEVPEADPVPTTPDIAPEPEVAPVEVEPEPISFNLDRNPVVAEVPGLEADDEPFVSPRPKSSPLRESVPSITPESGPLADLPNYSGPVESDVVLPNVIDGYLISDNLLEAGLDSQVLDSIYNGSAYWGVDQMSGELRARQLAELSEIMSLRGITDANEARVILDEMLRRDAMILNSFILEGERSLVTEENLRELLKVRDMSASRFYAWPDNLEPYANEQLTVGEAIERNLSEQTFNPTSGRHDGRILEYITSPQDGDRFA